MAQLSLFPTRHLRGRTLRRNYSPAAEQFRREHERHRSWGLTQRHARRLRQLREAEDGAAALARSVPETPRSDHETSPDKPDQNSADHGSAPDGEPRARVATAGSGPSPRRRELHIEPPPGRADHTCAGPLFGERGPPLRVTLAEAFYQHFAVGGAARLDDVKGGHQSSGGIWA